MDHCMIGGSHERPDGPECRCGATWDRWNDRCTSQVCMCDDCTALLPHWLETLPRHLREESNAVALHIACGIDHGGWACDHVDWTFQDASEAWAIVATIRTRERDQARQGLDDLGKAIRSHLWREYECEEPHEAVETWTSEASSHQLAAALIRVESKGER